jgi:PAS domain S-box-containing protein
MLRTKIFYFLMALASIIIVSVAGNVYINNQKEKSIKGVHNELVSIAMLKSDNVSDWYVDELFDAETISQNKTLFSFVENWENNGQVSDSIVLIGFLGSIVKEHGFEEILVLNNHDLIFSSTGSHKEIPLELKRHTNELTFGTNSVATPLYIDEQDGKIYIDFIGALRYDDNSILAYVFYRMSPERFLYPLLQNWPVPSQTAETILFSVDGDSIVFLNQLRHLANAPLTTKMPLTRTDVVAVQGALGLQGIAEGLNYNGVEVVSFVVDIPSTPWFLLAEIDKVEIYADVKDEARGFNLMLVLLLLLIISLLAFLYSNSQKKTFKSLWLAQEEFKTTLYSIGDGVITTDNEGVITHLNAVAEQLTGWKEKEAVGQPVEKVFNIINEDTHKRVDSPVRKVINEGVVVGLANHTLLVSKDGSQRPIADSGAPICDEYGYIKGVVLVFRDQSIERHHQIQLDEQRRRLLTLMSNLPGMVYRCKIDPDWTMEFVSKGCLALLGYNDYEVEGNKKIRYGDLIVEEDKGFVYQLVNEALANRTSFEIEYRIIDINGMRKWVWEKGQGIVGNNSQLVAIEGFIMDVTHRKDTESELRKSEKLFQTLAFNSGVGIFKTDVKGMTIFVNPKYCEITGLTGQHALGLGWIQNVHPDDRVKITANWSANLSNLKDGAEDYRFLHADGKVVWVSGNATPEFDENGQLLGYVGYLVDITEKVKSEEAIRHQNLLFNTVIENIPDAIYMKDTDGKKLIANKADIVNCGGSIPCDVLGKTDFDLFPSEIAQQFWKDDLKVLRDGLAIIDRMEKLVSRTGEIKWLKTSKIPIKDEKGKIHGLVGIGHDITRLKREEEERIKMTTVVEQTPLSIIITDKQGNIEYVNPKFTTVTGYSLNEVIGKNPRILKSGTQDDIFYSKMWEQLTKGKVWSSEFQNKKKNGELYWEFVFITPVVDSTGEIMKYAAVREDITEKRRMQQELIAAKIKAEESDKLKTSFLANMSHEIRTPLNSILGFTGILQESDELSPGERAEYTNIIRKSSDSLLQIINDIIDISSLETGQLKMVVNKFDVNRMINILHIEFTKRLVEFGKNNIELRKANTETELLILTDQNRLNQIFVNLLSNAFKFTNSGIIEFGIEKVDDRFIHFFVKDSGIGISEDMHLAVFERFRQAENQNNRNYGGNGLGLSIVKNLVELMGGNISLESEQGVGSKFYFYLPFEKR